MCHFWTSDDDQYGRNSIQSTKYCNSKCTTSVLCFFFSNMKERNHSFTQVSPWDSFNCDLFLSQVNVFVFGATKAGTWHHYFDKTLMPYVNDGHAGDFEYKTIRRLEEEKRIVMFKGWTWTELETLPERYVVVALQCWILQQGKSVSFTLGLLENKWYFQHFNMWKEPRRGPVTSDEQNWHLFILKISRLDNKFW